MKRSMILIALTACFSYATMATADDAKISIVKGGQTNLHTAFIRAGDTSAVLVVGDGDTDLDLYVYDPNGNLVGYDDDETDDCLVRWIPRVTGTYTIQIVNRSRIFANAYVIGLR